MNPATGTLGAIWFGGQQGRSNLARLFMTVLSPAWLRLGPKAKLDGSRRLRAI